MRPRAAADAVEHPYQAHRLEIAGAVDAADVDHAPAEGRADLADCPLCALIVTANEHVGRAAGELRLEKEGVADGVEGLDDAGAAELALDLLAQGVLEADEELRRAGGEVERVGGVDEDLVVEVLRAGEAQGLGCGSAERGQGNEVADPRALRERAAAEPGAGAGDKVAQLLRRARADHDFVPECGEGAGEGLADVSGAQDPHFCAVHGPGVYSAPGGSVCRKPMMASAHVGKKRRQSFVTNAATRPKMAHDSK